MRPLQDFAGLAYSSLALKGHAKVAFHPGPHPPAGQAKDVHVKASGLEAFGRILQSFAEGHKAAFVVICLGGRPTCYVVGELKRLAKPLTSCPT